MIVVDTNVVVYLLTGSGSSAEAGALLREDPEWAAPELLFSELRNVLVGMVYRGWIETGDAEEVIGDARRVFADRVVSVDDGSVLRCATKAGLTAYDAEFVVTAEALGVPLVTEDREVLKAVPRVARALAKR